MTAHALERGAAARGVAARRPACARERDRSGQRLAVHAELPADVGGGGGQRLLAGADRGVVADVRDPRRLRVEALRVSPDHGLVEAAGAALVERAVLVDESVVADVVPAVRVAVVAADGEHDLRRLFRRVVVEGDGVMHLHRLDAPVARRPARHAARGAPVLTRDVWERRRRGLGGANLRAALPDRHEVEPQSRHPPVEPVLDRARPPDPDGIRAALPVHAEMLPAPPAACAEHSQLHVGRRPAAPVQAHQVERARRGHLRAGRVGRGPLEIGGLRSQGGRDEGQGAQKHRC